MATISTPSGLSLGGAVASTSLTVDISAASSVGHTVTLAAGTYTVTFIGTQQGGEYDGWQWEVGVTSYTEALAITNGPSTSVANASAYFLVNGSGIEQDFSAANTALAAFQAAETAGTLTLAKGFSDPPVTQGLYLQQIPNIVGNTGLITDTLAGSGLVTFAAPDDNYKDNSGGVSILVTEAAQANSDSGVQGDGITNDDAPVVTGTADPGAVVTVEAVGPTAPGSAGGTITLGTGTANASGVWSIKAPVLNDGTYAVSAVAVESSGTSAASTPTTLVIDTVAPAAPSVTLAPASDTGVKGDGITDLVTPTLTGTAEANSTVTVSDAAGTLGTTTATGAGTWTLALTSPLASGTYAVTATAADAADNVSAPSIPFALTIDTHTPPAATIGLAPASDSGVKGDDITNVTTPTLTGTAEPGDTITVFDGTTLAGAATASAGGVWSLPITTALATGRSIFVAIPTDVAGTNGSGSSFALTIDTHTPIAPSIGLAPASDSGVPGDGITNVATPTLTGTGEAGDTVTVKNGLTTLGTATVSGAGTWSLAISPPLASGGYSLTASETDPAGTISSVTNFPLTIDTHTPVAPSVGLTLATDSGAKGDGITNVAAPTLTGTGEAGDTITVKNGVTPLGTATVGGDGTWSLAITPALTSGTYPLAVTETDPAGTTSSVTNFPLTIDTHTPVAPTIGLTLATDSGAKGDGITNVATPTLTGTGEAGDTVTVTNGTATLGTATVSGTGTWSLAVTPPLASGGYSIAATETDPAGTTSSPSSPFALTITTSTLAAPSVGLTPATDSGVTGDGITNVASPTLTGTGEVGATVTLTSNGTTTLGTVTVSGAGTWSLPITPALTSGAYAITAIESNAAGDISPTATFALTIDTHTPAAPSIGLAPATDSGAKGDGITNVATPTLTGTGEVGDTVTVTNGATTLGTATVSGAGTWSLAVTPALASGAYPLTASETDPAGSSSSATAFALTIDTVAPLAPSVTLGGTGGTAVTNTPTPTLSGTAEPGATVAVTGGGGTVLGTTTATPAGTWSLTLPAQPAGTQTDTATATDAAGNISAAASPLTLTIDNLAQPVFQQTGGSGTLTQSGTVATLDLGTVTQGGAPLTASLSVLNGAASPADLLSGNFTAPASAGFTDTGLAAFSGLGAGQSDAAPSITLGTASTGTFSQTITLDPTDSNGSGESVALAPRVLTVTGTVAAARTSNAVTGILPFAGLGVSATSASPVTVAAAITPTVPGSFISLAGGTLDPTGTVFSLSQTASVASAALAGATFVPTTSGATLPGVSATINGAAGGGAALFDAGGGADQLIAGTGNDTLLAAPARAQLIGGPGADLLWALGASDTISGGAGAATIVGGSTGTTIATNAANDVVFDGGGKDAIFGTSGADTVLALSGGDTVSAGTGANLIGAAVGNNLIFSIGADTVVAGAGADTMTIGGNALAFGGGGTLLVFNGAGTSTMIGGAGATTLVGGAGGGLFGGGTGGNNLLFAGQIATTLFGGGAADTLVGTGSANDVFVAAGGNETLFAGSSSGNDIFFAGSGNESIVTGTGASVVEAGSGNATVTLGLAANKVAFVQGRVGGSDVINGFVVGTDKISLQGYGASAAQFAAAHATLAGNATTFLLSDGTKVTLAGITSLNNVFG